MKRILIPITLILTISCEKDPEFQTVNDIDGNEYRIVNIGSQTWFAENLRTTRFSDGTLIPLEKGQMTWKSLKTSAYCYFWNDDECRDIFGLLYNWYALVDSCKLCPEGWRVPSTDDWEELISYLGGDEIAGGKMKAVDTILWDQPNEGATDESGFSALPGGYRNQTSEFVGLGFRGSFWSTTVYNELAADVLITERRFPKARIDFATYEHGYYVRCLKNE